MEFHNRYRNQFSTEMEYDKSFDVCYIVKSNAIAINIRFKLH